MSDAEEERKKHFATLKRYLEREQARVDREMPGATDKEKAKVVGARLFESGEAHRKSKEIEQSTAVLRGKKLLREQNQSDRDYSGGGFYHEESETILLFADQTFRYEKRRFSSVSTGSHSLPSERKQTREGTWAVEIIDGAPHLILTAAGTVFNRWRTKNGNTGVHYLDEERWQRFKM